MIPYSIPDPNGTIIALTKSNCWNILMGITGIAHRSEYIIDLILMVLPGILLYPLIKIYASINPSIIAIKKSLKIK